MNSEWVAFVSIGIALFTTLDSLLQRYASKTGKRYAAERDFAQLQLNQQEMRRVLESLEGRIDKLDREVIALAASFRLYGGIKFPPEKSDASLP
jgi:hypothetical protein